MKNDKYQVIVSLPAFASQIVINKEKTYWHCSLVAGSYKNSSIEGCECQHGNGSNAQSAIDDAEKKFDFNSAYWKHVRNKST